MRDIIVNQTCGERPKLVSRVPAVGLVMAVAVLLPLGPLSAMAAEPDVLISITGEKFIGELESATAVEVTFKSESAGEITVPWGKVKELHSALRFAVIPKNVKFSSAEEANRIPEGTVSVADKRIEIQSAPKTTA